MALPFRITSSAPLRVTNTAKSSPVAKKAPSNRNYIILNISPNLDIISVDATVRTVISENALELERLRKCVEIAKQDFLEGNATTIQHEVKLRSEITTIESKIAELEDSIATMVKYSADAQKLLVQFKNLPRVVRKTDITKKSTPSQLDDDTTLRLGIVRKYAALLGKYVSVSIVDVDYSTKNEDACDMCSESLDGIIVDRNGNRTCTCGNEQRFEKKTTGDVKEKESEEIFRKALYKYAGKSSIKICVDKVVEALDRYSLACKKNKGSYYAALKSDVYGYKPGTSVDTLTSALKAVNMSLLVEDVYLVGNYYYGWDSQARALDLEEIIMSDFRETEDIWNSLDANERESLTKIPTQLRLYRHLQLRGWNCKTDHFRISDNQLTLTKYDETWNILCERCPNNSIYWMEM